MARAGDPMNRGRQLDAIIDALDQATAAWVAAGYPMNGPEHDAREAVFARLREWNAAGGYRMTCAGCGGGFVTDDAELRHCVTCRRVFPARRDTR